MRVEVLHVILIGTLISWFKTMGEQNSIWFFTSELITIFSLEVFTFFYKKLMPFCKIFIFMSPRTNISFLICLKNFKISTNYCKKLVHLGDLKAVPIDMGLVFGRSKSTKVTLIFLERIFLALQQMSCFM